MLKYCDFLSPPITLYYRNQERHSSSLSGLLTIIAYMIIIIFSIIFSLDFLLKMNPTSYFYNKFVSDIGYFPFNSSGIFHFIVIGEQVNLDYNNRTFSIIGVNEEYNIFLQNNSEINIDHWIYSPCSDSDIDNLKKYLNEYNVSYSKGLCIDKFYNATSKNIINKQDNNFIYPILKHGNSNLNGNTYGIFLLRCQNHSELNKTNCYDSNSSDLYALKTLSFSIYFIDSYIDVTNYHYPLIKFYNKIRNQIVLSSFTVNHLNFKPLELISHTGLIFNKKEKLNSFNFDVNEKLTINQEDTGIYGSFYFWMENQMGIYDRTYQKVQDICASISGLTKLIMIIGYFLNYSIYEVTLIQDLSIDIDKKIEKFGRKSTKGLISMNLTKIINSPGPILNNNSQTPENNINIILNNNLNFNSNYNNFVLDTNLSKLNLTSKKSLNTKLNINCCDILKNKFHLKKNALIQQVISTRMKVLSEEKLFTTYYIIGTLCDKIERTQTYTQKMKQSNELQRKNTKMSLPHKNLYN
jgi:hypothetical protein